MLILYPLFKTGNWGISKREDELWAQISHQLKAWDIGHIDAIFGLKILSAFGGKMYMAF